MNRSGDGPRPVGATVRGSGTHFEVWAPSASSVGLLLYDAEGGSRELAMTAAGGGRWAADVDGVGHGARYRFRLDAGDALADPASRWQPDGVHGPSAVVDPGRFEWTDQGWSGVELPDAVLYELHVGTFTPEGTLVAAIDQLDRLAELGVTLVELMPLNAVAGARNWGYDGVFVSAVQAAYGGPEQLARFVDAAHARGLGVVLDVVYNHLGPEGNVLPRYGPYLTDVTRTPWGDAINVAGPGSDEVRDLFVQSARQWIEDFHVDGLRLDAIDALVDQTARPFLEELTTAVHDVAAAAGRRVLIFAESASNDPRVVRPAADGGLGFDAMWNDDVHHSLRVALLGDRRGYYADFDGVGDLALALADRWVVHGRYSVSRGRRHGRPAEGVDHRRLVVFSANHDQVGNTPDGQRPPFDRGRRLVAAATVILSPFTPLLFMGEEYAETAPFPFFVDHSDPELLDATRAGRQAEFASAEWDRPILDPASEATFAAAVLDPSQAAQSPHREVLAAHRELLRLRRGLPVLTDPAAAHEVTRDGDTIVVARRLGDVQAQLILAFGDWAADVAVPGGAAVVFDSDDERWGGDGPSSVRDGRLRRSGPGAVLIVSG